MKIALQIKMIMNDIIVELLQGDKVYHYCIIGNSTEKLKIGEAISLWTPGSYGKLIIVSGKLVSFKLR